MEELVIIEFYLHINILIHLKIENRRGIDIDKQQFKCLDILFLGVMLDVIYNVEC